jgi:hypothetical protein
MNLRLSRAALYAAALFAGLVACGGGGNGAPSTPSIPPPTQPPSTTPPLAANPPLSVTCNRLIPGKASGQEKCRMEGPTYLEEVERAIDLLVAQQPQIFDLNQAQGAGGYKVLSEGAYFVGVIQNLDQLGHCGGLYGEELAVTDTAGYSDNFDIMNADHFIRRGYNSYRSTCYPASFTTPLAPSGNSRGCSLPASRSIACSREGRATFREAVEEALDQIIKEQPGIFDLNDVQKGGAGWYLVKDTEAYTQGVVNILLAKGHCARWDGEELNVKTDNISSENYDILTAERHIRRGDGAYRVTCYPAYF